MFQMSASSLKRLKLIHSRRLATVNTEVRNKYVDLSNGRLNMTMTQKCNRDKVTPLRSLPVHVIPKPNSYYLVNLVKIFIFIFQL